MAQGTNVLSWNLRIFKNTFFLQNTFVRLLLQVTQQTLLVLKTSWRRLQDMSSRRLQHVFTATILRLRDVLKTFCKDVLKTSWRHLARRLEDVLKTSWKTKSCYAEDVLKTYLEEVLKTFLEVILKTLWRQTKFLLGISVSNKSKCVSNKSIFHKSISDNSNANPKCIN